jgi:hypothetical protein
MAMRGNATGGLPDASRRVDCPKHADAPCLVSRRRDTRRIAAAKRIEVSFERSPKPGGRL